MKALIAAGADMKAATKVVDLAALTSPEEEFFRQQQPQQAGAPAAQGGRAPGAPAGQPAAARRPAQRRAARVVAADAEVRSGVAGIDRQFRYNELVAIREASRRC